MKRPEHNTRLVVLANTCAPGGQNLRRNVIYDGDTAPGPFAGAYSTRKPNIPDLPETIQERAYTSPIWYYHH